MISETTRRSARPTFTALLEGLLADMKVLAIQEFRLATQEVREELGKAQSAASSLALAIGLAAIGGLLLILMVVHALAEAGLPLWASYGLVGLALGGTGVGLLIRAKHQAAEIHVLPIRTVQTMKENVSWIKEEVTSARM
ncbi:MAG: phage holin family protein [Nitrospirales bacterium]|nr:phage holin family protein [Nitrospirales bacterium]